MSAARAVGTVPVVRTLLAAALGALLLVLAAPPPASADAPAGPADPAAASAVRGGDTLYAEGGTQCAVGINATDGSAYYGILPGHCGQTGIRWYADPQRQVPVGETVDAQFPPRGWSLVRYTNPELTYPSEISTSDGPLRIEGAAEATVGMHICAPGSTTGRYCGTVEAVDVSVSYPEGTIDGLIQTNLCAGPGEPPGPALSGNDVVGILVGGSGDCTSGGQTFYQPVTRVLGERGLTVGY